MIISNEEEIEDGNIVSSGTGTDSGFLVEVRNTYHTPEVICGVVLDNRWRRIPLEQNNQGFGVPLTRYRPGRAHVNLLTRTEAEAFRWMFLAHVEAERGCPKFCLETRIVEVQMKYEFSAKEVRYIDALDSRMEKPKEKENSAS